MKKFRQSLTPEAIHQIIGGDYVANKTVSLSSIADAGEAEVHSVIFIDNDKFLSHVKSSKAGLIIAGNKYKDELNYHESNLIFVDNAYHAVLILMHYWQETEKADFVSFVHPTAVIGDNVTLSDNVRVGPYAVLAENASIGDFVHVDAFCSIGENVSIGNNCHFYPNVTIYNDTIIGNNVVINSGCVIKLKKIFTNKGSSFILHSHNILDR